MKQTTRPALRHAAPTRRTRTDGQTKRLSKLLAVPRPRPPRETGPNQTYLLQMGEHIWPQLPDEIVPHGEAPQGSQADERQMGQVGDLIRVECQIP